MWYQTLPSLFIVGAALVLPDFISYLSCKLIVGNFYARRVLSTWDAQMYLRDMRLTGDPYKQLDLNCLPDEPEKPAEDKAKTC